MTRDGFTLLEAMVSMAILSLVGIAALGAVGRDLDVAARARTALEAAALAEDRLEALRLLEAAGLAALPDSLARGRFEPPFERYGWTAAVTPVAGEPGLFEARVEVAWDGGRRPLEAVLYRRPVAVSP